MSNTNVGGSSGRSACESMRGAAEPPHSLARAWNWLCMTIKLHCTHVARRFLFTWRLSLVAGAITCSSFAATGPSVALLDDRQNADRLLVVDCLLPGIKFISPMETADELIITI